MDMLKTGWNFFQNEVVGMAWLNRLIGNLINACGLDATSKIGGGIQFFVYDTIKIMVLLGVLILIISYIQSYFPPVYVLDSDCMVTVSIYFPSSFALNRSTIA